MSAEVILFGIGAQKAGTSWLHEYFRSHPDCHLRGTKEIGYFDRLEKGGMRRVRNGLARTGLRLRERKDAASHNAWLDVLVAENAELQDLVAQVRKRQDNADAAYLRFLRAGRADRRLIGEINPEYSTCGEAALARMLALGPDVRFLLVLRDPVGRAWSQVRMDVMRSLPAGGDAEAATSAMIDLWLQGEGRQIALRSDYGRMLELLLRGVPEEKRLICFYEEMFRQDSVDRITDFLGISRFPARLAHVVHRGSDRGIDPQVRQRVFAYLRDQYAAVESMLGRLPPQWQRTISEAA